MPGCGARRGSEGPDGMSQQRPSASGAHGDVRGWARLALSACLLALVAVGLRATVPAPALDGPFRHDGLPVGVALEVVLACLLLALVVRNARAPRDAVLAAQLRRLLTYVVVTGLIAIPAAYLLSRHVRPPRPRAAPSGKVKPGTAPHPPPPDHASAGLLIVIIVLGVLAAAGLIWLIVILLRGRFWLGFRRGAAGTAVGLAADDDGPDLLEAVESGRRALRQFDDARAAIIACYVAMEQSLARAGTARAAADTPDELLARAAGEGLVTGDAAARLTALFYEARFSSHPVPLARRDEAQRALAELAHGLGDPELAGAGGQAGGGRSDGADRGEYP
jgi:hypothetical protein